MSAKYLVFHSLILLVLFANLMHQRILISVFFLYYTKLSSHNMITYLISSDLITRRVKLDRDREHAAFTPKIVQTRHQAGSRLNET